MKLIFTTITAIVFLATGLNAQLQIQNPGFENWEDAGTVEEEPVNWSSIKTSDDVFYNNLAPVVWGKSEDAHSGNYSLSLFNVGSLVIATGTICNGRYHTQLPADSSYVFTDINDDRWNSPLAGRPDSVVGWYKCNPGIGDFGTIKFMLHKGYAQIPGSEESSIAIAYMELPTTEVNTWTRFSIPFDYYSGETPEYYLAILTSGNGVDAQLNSTALFDDLEFIYNGSSISELTAQKLHVSIVNNNLIINSLSDSNEPFVFKLMDLNGRIVHNEQLLLSGYNKINIAHLKKGVYIATATNSSEYFMNKIMIVR